MIPTEHEVQSMLVSWAEHAAQSTRPELRLLFAIPNGGDRNVVVASKLKREGVKAGVPDLFLPVPRGGFHGLWVEMKRIKARQTKTKGVRLDRTKTSPEQDWWQLELWEQGYAVAVCWTVDEAKAAIEEYLDGEAA